MKPMKQHRTLSLLCAGGLALAAPFSTALAGGGYLGIQISRATEALRTQLGITAGFGLVVDGLPDESPAANLLQAHDVLLEIDGQKVINEDQLLTLLDIKNPGDEVELVIVRGGQEQTVKIALGERPAGQTKPKAQAQNAASAAAVADIGALLEGLGLSSLSGLAGLSPEVQVHTLDLTGNEVDQNEIIAIVEELGIDADELTQQIQDAVAQMTTKAKGDSSDAVNIVESKVLANVTMDDGTHKIVVKDDGKEKHLIAWDKDGKEIFNGPINTEEQLNAVPKKIKNKIPTVKSGNTSAIIKSVISTEEPAEEPTEEPTEEE
jgi:hypothetical protein